MFDALKPKYHTLYMDMAIRAANETVAKKLIVGCAIVTPQGLISVGWNGMPAGMPNECEYPAGHERAGKTRPEVIHAERNALDKLARQTTLAKGSIVFTTHSPCIECAKSLLAAEVKEVWFCEDFNKSAGKNFLNNMDIPCRMFEGYSTKLGLREKEVVIC